MILDKSSNFATAVSVALAAGTSILGDVVDLGANHRDIGNGQDMHLVITVDTSILTGGVAGTIEFQLVTAPTANLLAGTVVLAQSPAFATGAAAADPLKQGDVAWEITLPVEGSVYAEFLGILVVVATTATTQGKVNAFLTLDKHGWQAYKAII